MPTRRSQRDVQRLIEEQPRNPETGCWEWQGERRIHGYGMVKWLGKQYRAHRLAWMVIRGPIPAGEGYHGTCVLHICDNRLCVNPEHLRLGTQSQNMDEKRERKRARRLTEEQVVEIRLRAGERQVDLAAEFGVSQGSISKILRGETWKDL